jgi:hypothetical protein
MTSGAASDLIPLTRRLAGREMTAEADDVSVLDLAVTARYMHGGKDGVDVSAVLRPAMLAQVLDGASRIWMAGGIRLVLSGIDHHAYALRDWGYRDEHEQVPSPTSDLRLFRALNAAYGTPQLSGVDLFVFWKIEGDAGYGAPDRADGPTPGRGAAWIDTDCLAVTDAEATYARLVAHEIGHVLRLCHACSLGGRPESPCADPSCPNPVIDDGRLAPCRRECRRLMRADYAGTELLPFEIGRARASVRGRLAANLNEARRV